MGFSRQEHWSGLPFPLPGDVPDPGTEPASPALAGRLFTTEPPGSWYPCIFVVFQQLTFWDACSWEFAPTQRKHSSLTVPCVPRADPLSGVCHADRGGPQSCWLPYTELPAPFLLPSALPNCFCWCWFPAAINYSRLALLACFSEHSPPQVAFWPQAVWLPNGSVPKLCKPGAPEVLCDFKMPELLHVTAACNLLSTVQI